MRHKVDYTFLTLFAMTAAIAAGLFLPESVRAEAINAEKWDISADKMTRYENPPRIIAEGNVILQKTRTSTQQVKTQGTWDRLLEETSDTAEQEETKTVTRTDTLTTIKADWITYNIDLGSIKARGNLMIEVGQDMLKAANGEVDLKKETGTFTDATIIRGDNNIHLEGKVIEKTGDITYRIEDGWVITCKLKDNQTPPWSFAAKNADITEGGYAILKHTTFRIKNIPVLYTPWMIVPVKNTRQTGFIFPEVSISSRDGFGLNLPFFVNLSPSSDMTIYPEFLSERGLNMGAEFRYIMDKDTKGSFMANYLHDNLSDPSETDYYNDNNFTHTNKNRYWFRGKADTVVGDWITRLDLDVVSDRDYLPEFTSGMTGFNTSHEQFIDIFGRGFETYTLDERKNTFRILRPMEDSSLNIELLGINDNRLDKSAPTPLWKLPSVNYDGLVPLGDTLFNFEWQAEYVNYWRQDGVGAHRIDLFPKLTAPIPLGDYLEATAGVGLRETYYIIREYGDSSWNGSDTENRLLYELTAEIGTTLIGDFTPASEEIDTFRHTFRPYISYTYIPDEDQSDLPQLDETDMVEETNLFIYGFDNFFKIFGTSNSKPYEREYGYFKIYHGYDFRSEEDDTPFIPVNIEIGYTPLTSIWMKYKTEIDVYGDGALIHGFEGAYANKRGDRIYATYRYDDLNSVDSVSLDVKLNLTNNFMAAYKINRSLEDSITVEEKVALVYSPECWSVETSYTKTPSDEKFLIVFRLANIGNPLGINL